MSDPFSFKDFTGWDLRDHPELVKLLVPGTIIVGSCFSSETPDSEFIPKSTTGVMFKGCNLDNRAVPPGNTLLDCSIRRFMAVNGVDMLVDSKNAPLGPLESQPDAPPKLEDFSPASVEAIQAILLSVYTKEKTVAQALDDVSKLPPDIKPAASAEMAVLAEEKI